jgi:hypothetical protein
VLLLPETEINDCKSKPSDAPHRNTLKITPGSGSLDMLGQSSLNTTEEQLPQSGLLRELIHF